MKGDRLYLQHILDAIKKVEEYVSVSYQTFMTSSHWQDAVIRQLEIIGEATQRLSTQLCSKHADIPWSRIAELRDVLIHAYMGVDIKAVWKIHATELARSQNPHQNDPDQSRQHIKTRTRLLAMTTLAVIPAPAGIQVSLIGNKTANLDSRFHGNDGMRGSRTALTLHSSTESLTTRVTRQ
ncbi:MAG: HepT-like ribonuclease domain-containing protein [Candidatus Binatia bacterium]